MQKIYRKIQNICDMYAYRCNIYMHLYAIYIHVYALYNNNLFTQPPRGDQAGSAHTAKGAGPHIHIGAYAQNMQEMSSYMH